jgi:hypothetical protein
VPKLTLTADIIDNNKESKTNMYNKQISRKPYWMKPLNPRVLDGFSLLGDGCNNSCVISEVTLTLQMPAL